MSAVDRFPSTPVKLITGWLAFCVMLLFSLAAMWRARPIDREMFITVWAAVLAYNGIAFAQFWTKRATAWEPPVEPTRSEAARPPASGQPAVAAPPPATVA